MFIPDRVRGRERNRECKSEVYPSCYVYCGFGSLDNALWCHALNQVLLDGACDLFAHASVRGAFAVV